MESESSTSKIRAWIYGHHVKPQWTAEFSSLEELAKSNAGRLPEMIAGRSFVLGSEKKTAKRWKVSSELPHDDFMDFRDGKSLRKCGLTQWCHLKSKLEGRCSRAMLMNDEIAFQWSTGSYVAWRLWDKKLARDLWTMLATGVPGAEVKTAEKKFMWDVGDRVQLVRDFTAAGMAGSVSFKRGKILRVYDISEKSFVPAPVQGETLLKIPGTKWAWAWLGYAEIPLECAELVEPLK